MAGSGYRTFTDGQVLTGAAIQGYLQDQAVMVFASSAARSTALGTAVAAGMVSFTSADSLLSVYKSGAWAQLAYVTDTVANATRVGNRLVSVGTAAPGTPTTGDIWIQI